MRGVIWSALVVLLAYGVRACGRCRAGVLFGAAQRPKRCTKSHLITVRSERSDPSADLVSQHWRGAASRWVARRAQGVTLTKRSTNVQSEGAAKRVGTSSALGRGSPERARGYPYQALHECAEAKVHLILKESLAKPGNKVIDLSGRDGQERKGSLPVGPRQTATPFGLVA